MTNSFLAGAVALETVDLVRLLTIPASHTYSLSFVESLSSEYHYTIGDSALEIDISLLIEEDGVDCDWADAEPFVLWQVSSFPATLQISPTSLTSPLSLRTQEERIRISTSNESKAGGPYNFEFQADIFFNSVSE